MKLNEVKSSELESKFIRQGIENEIVFVEAEGFDTPESGKPRVTIKLAKKIADDTQGTVFRLSLGDSNLVTGELDKAGKWSLTKIRHLVDAVCPVEVADALSYDTPSELAAELNRVLKGKTWKQFKFVGEEYINHAGEVKVKANIGLPTFCLGTYSPEGRSLKYDVNNQYDYVRIVKPTPVEGGMLI